MDFMSLYNTINVNLRFKNRGTIMCNTEVMFYRKNSKSFVHRNNTFSRNTLYFPEYGDQEFKHVQH